MKSNKPGLIGRIGTVSSLALLLALSGCGGGADGETITAEEEGPPPHSNSQQASIGVSNTCELASDVVTGKPVLRVTTTIVDKSSGDVTAYLKADGITVIAEEKGRGKQPYEQVGETAAYTGEIGVNSVDIQLCGDDGSYLGPDDTVSMNASISVSVINDNKEDYYSRCSDDPTTDGIDEGKVLASAAELNWLCSQ